MVVWYHAVRKLEHPAARRCYGPRNACDAAARDAAARDAAARDALRGAAPASRRLGEEIARVSLFENNFHMLIRASQCVVVGSEVEHILHLHP